MTSFGQDKLNAPRLKSKYNGKVLSRTFECEEIIVTDTTIIYFPIQISRLAQDIVLKQKDTGLKLVACSLVDIDSRLIFDILVGLDYLSIIETRCLSGDRVFVCTENKICLDSTSSRN